MKLFDPKFWEEEWDNAIKKEEQRSNQEKIEMWNKRADNFDKNVSTSSGKERIQETISFLDNYRVLEEPKMILDIGCGPGHYAIEFAKRGHKVYALDPAEKMIEKMKEKLAEEDKEVVKRIIPSTEDWLEVDINERGYYKKFDLVFASMSPGINNAKTLQKAINCSKKYCFISRFSGQRFRASIAHILEKYLDLEECSHMDIFYPLNWLYSSGYKPVLHFDSWGRRDKQPLEEAKKEIKQIISTFIVVDEKVEKDIDEYLYLYQEDDYISEDKGAVAGLVLFDVNSKCLEINYL